MPTPHIGAQNGDFAKVVLMPGDPRRAEWIAKTFLKDPKLVTDIRGILGFTGKAPDGSFNGFFRDLSFLIFRQHLRQPQLNASDCGVS